jgi:protocatechuate 3,4-dioxygenase beta subunit
MKIAAILVLAAAALSTTAATAGAAGGVCPVHNNPNEIVVAGGSGQSAQLGKPFGSPFQVGLANTNGCPLTGNLAGINIDFDAPGAGASGLFSSTGSNKAVVGTDAQGIATAPSFTANDTVGSYTVDAHSDYGTVEFFVTNTAAGIPTAIAATGTTDQQATVNSQYAQPLQARVTDANGNPVQGATISFSVVPGTTGAGAMFLGGAATATTDSTGLATSPPLLANGTPGRFTATASTEGVSTVATYTFDNHAGVTTFAAAGSSKANARVEARYRQPLTVTVRDATGKPVEGATVNFTVAPADSGASATFVGSSSQATATTDANGRASSPPLVANKTAGSFTATASTGDQTLRYRLTNVPGAPASITAGAASGESTVIKTRFPVPLAVTVTDQYGNAVVGRVVVFTTPTHGPSGHFANRSRRIRIATNRNGVAVAPPLTANRKAGGFVVTARVEGTSPRAAFALVNKARG